MQGTLGVSGHTDLLGQPWREITGELPLVKRSAADGGRAVGANELQGGKIPVAVGLGRKSEGFRHSEVEWQLDKAEMILLSAGRASAFEAGGQRDVRLFTNGDAERVPRGNAVPSNLGIANRLFHRGEGALEPGAQGFAGDVPQLGFGIMDVEDVDGLKTEIPPAALELVFEIPRSHTVHPTRQFLRLEDSGGYVFPGEISTGIGGNGAIEREITGLRANDEFVTANFSGVDQVLKGGANRSLRALMPVVDGGVNYIDAGAECGLDGLGIELIGSFVGLAEIGAETEGGEPDLVRARNVLGLAEMPGCLQTRETIGKSVGALWRREALDNSSMDINYLTGVGQTSRKGSASVGMSAACKPGPRKLIPQNSEEVLR